MKFVLILMIFTVTGWGENAVSVQKVEGFTSQHTCEVAGESFNKNDKVGTAYKKEYVCLPVE